MKPHEQKLDTVKRPRKPNEGTPQNPPPKNDDKKEKKV